MSAKKQKPVNLALQGGGSHGAFTWGVLDYLFEDDRLHIEAMSGTSAGAMNAVIAAHGMQHGGSAGAREALREFWRSVSAAAQASPFRRSVRAQIMGDWSLDDSPGLIAFNALSGVASPYDLNAFDINPLRDIVESHVDFEQLAKDGAPKLFLGATNVETGRVRVFNGEEVTLDAVMASACLPHVFKAVEIDGEFFWDGGYMGNPPLFPFAYGSSSADVVIVQINPIFRAGPPRSAADIANRVSEITFNSSLLHELRAIDFVGRMLDRGKLGEDEYRRMHIHMIHARKQIRPLEASSKMNAEWSFLEFLFDVGRKTAKSWLHRHFNEIGEKSTLDVHSAFRTPEEKKRGSEK